MPINIMIGYDDHTSTYKVDEHVATNLLEMDSADNINDYITSMGMIVTDTYDCQNANVFLDISGDDIELFLADLKEEVSTNNR